MVSRPVPAHERDRPPTACCSNSGRACARAPRRCLRAERNPPGRQRAARARRDGRPTGGDPLALLHVDHGRLRASVPSRSPNHEGPRAPRRAVSAPPRSTSRFPSPSTTSGVVTPMAAPSPFTMCLRQLDACVGLLLARAAMLGRRPGMLGFVDDMSAERLRARSGPLGPRSYRIDERVRSLMSTALRRARRQCRNDVKAPDEERCHASWEAWRMQVECAGRTSMACQRFHPHAASIW
jgi:hypothetical protein